MLRRLQHDSILGNMNWFPIEVGWTKCYIAHELIQNFLQQTALPPDELESFIVVMFCTPAAGGFPSSKRHPC